MEQYLYIDALLACIRHSIGPRGQAPHCHSAFDRLWACVAWHRLSSLYKVPYLFTLSSRQRSFSSLFLCNHKPDLRPLRIFFLKEKTHTPNVLVATSKAFFMLPFVSFTLPMNFHIHHMNLLSQLLLSLSHRYNTNPHMKECERVSNYSPA